MARSEGWDIEISARPVLEVDVASLWRYRDLITMFVRRDFVAFYKQTVLGPLWYVVQPLLTTSVFSLKRSASKLESPRKRAFGTAIRIDSYARLMLPCLTSPQPI